jgi:hypothetical protein
MVTDSPFGSVETKQEACKIYDVMLQCIQVHHNAL